MYLHLFTGQGMVEKAEEEITGQFSSLQLKVRKAMDAKSIQVDDVCQFLAPFFGDRHIVDVPDLTKMFTYISRVKLWNYNSYGVLKQMIKEFLPNDKCVKESMTDYCNQHSGFSATKIIIQKMNIEEKGPEGGTPQTFLPEKYRPDFCNLKVKLDLIKCPTEITLGHVNNLWDSLAEEFDVPPLSAVLDKIITGSIVIIWLILPSIAEKIRRSASKALKFYQHHDIVEIYIDYDPVYKEEWIVSLLLKYVLLNTCMLLMKIVACLYCLCIFNILY